MSMKNNHFTFPVSIFVLLGSKEKFGANIVSKWIFQHRGQRPEQFSGTYSPPQPVNGGRIFKTLLRCGYSSTVDDLGPQGSPTETTTEKNTTQTGMQKQQEQFLIYSSPGKYR